jgi:thioredoxin 1
MIINVMDGSFEEMVLNSKKPVLVDFWAEWCGPCKMIVPILDEISKEEIGDKIVIAKIDIDKNPEIPTKYGVRGIPTLMLFKDGILIDTKVGLIPKQKIVEWINSNI